MPPLTSESTLQTNADGSRKLLVSIDLPPEAEIDNIWQFEEGARDVANTVGLKIMEVGLAAFDTMGEPIKVGKVLHTSKGKTPNTYHTSFGDIIISRHTYQNSHGGVTQVPLEDRARIIANCTPLYASHLAAGLAELPVNHVVRRLLEETGLGEGEKRARGEGRGREGRGKTGIGHWGQLYRCAVETRGCGSGPVLAM